MEIQTKRNLDCLQRFFLEALGVGVSGGEEAEKKGCRICEGSEQCGHSTYSGILLGPSFWSKAPKKQCRQEHQAAKVNGPAEPVVLPPTHSFCLSAVGSPSRSRNGRQSSAYYMQQDWGQDGYRQNLAAPHPLKIVLGSLCYSAPT